MRKEGRGVEPLTAEVVDSEIPPRTAIARLPQTAHRVLSPKDVKAHVNRIQKVMKSVMKKGTHYDKVPGCGEKPVLLKPGSEVLLTLFRIAIKPKITDLSDEDEIAYRVECAGVNLATGQEIGVGVGEASSNEDKFKWRYAVCKEEFDEAPTKERRFKYSKKYDGGGGYEKSMQIRVPPADLGNKVLKMAKKRAQIDLVLTATAASDIFTQDLEDYNEANFSKENDTAGDQRDRAQQRREGARTSTKTPQRRSGGAGPGKPLNGTRINEQQVAVVKAQMGRAGLSSGDFLKRFNLMSLSDITTGQLNEVLAWIRDPENK